MSCVIEVRELVTRFGDNLVHDGVSLCVGRGEIYGLMGGSGSGKSTLLRTIIGLLRPQGGAIRVLGLDPWHLDHRQADWLRRHWGVLFQSGALYSSLTVAQNIGLPLREYTRLPPDLIEEIVHMKIRMVGLPERAAGLHPAQLSGGMVKRAALARALALDPQLLFLDEPTSGLDPVGAEAFDRLIRQLRDSLGLTVMMVTHDLDSIFTIVDRFAVLGDRKVVAEGTLDEVMATPHPVIQQFFHGERGRLRAAGRRHGQ